MLFSFKGTTGYINQEKIKALTTDDQAIKENPLFLRKAIKLNFTG